jgi:hypothetical protein
MKRKILIAFLLLLLTACASTQTPVANGSNILPTMVATWTPKPTRTPVPLPTRRPSSTATETKTPRVRLWPTQTEIADDPVLATLWAPFKTCHVYRNKEKFSPSANWYICGDGYGFEVMHRDGTSWSFSPKEDYGIEYYGDIRLIHWTRDEKFLYFAVMNPLDGPGPITINAEALFRMELADGKITTILGSLDYDAIEGFYSLSISPTSRRLVYSKSPFYRDVPHPKSLHIVDLQSGEETVLPIEARYNTIGRFVWSNDGLLLAYKLYNTSFEGYCEYSYSIRLLDLTDFTSITIVKDVIVEHCQQPPDEFNIQDEFDNAINLEKNGEIWQYDINAQRLRLISTPEP